MDMNLIRNRRLKIFFFFVLTALVVFYLYCLFANIKKQAHTNFLFFLIFANFLTIFLFWCIVHILMILSGPNSLKLAKAKGMTDFIIGDEGGYSLSRLQAVFWAITIISYLITIQIVLFLRNDLHDQSLYFDPDISESALWLLALSLTSAITVKGITVDKIKGDPARLFSKARRKPKLIDIITGDNGLDFSKCQMLIWTIIAIFIFNQKVYQFAYSAYAIKSDNLPVLFNNFYEDYSEKKPADQARIKDEKLPYLPYLPWTFIVLMGLSQGAYLGKKLVPNFKVSDIRTAKSAELERERADLQVKQQLLSQIMANSSQRPTSLNTLNLNNLQSEITSVQTRIASLEKEILDIDDFNI